MPSSTSRSCVLCLALLASPVNAGGGGAPVPDVTMLNMNGDRNAESVRLRVAPDGRVYAAWLEDTRAPGEQFGRGVFVKMFDQGRWVALGDNLNYIRERNASDLDLTLDEHGRPALAWSENFAHADMNNFRAWLGNRWSDWDERRIGQDLTYAARSRSLAVWNGAPHLAWGDILREGSGTVLRLKSWREGTWVNSADFSRDATAYAQAPSLAVTRQGAFVVAWLEGNVATSDVLVARGSGGAWNPVGEPLNVRSGTYTFSPVLRLDTQNQPVVTWIEETQGVDVVYVKRWNGRRWVQLGGSLNARPDLSADRVALDTGAEGQLVVAWTEGPEGERVLHARRWDRDRWRPLGAGPVAVRDTASPAVGVDAAGRTYVAYSELVQGVRRVFVRHFAPAE